VAVYRIIRVRRSKATGHVTKVAFRKDTGNKLKKLQTASVEQVRSMIDRGHHFYTFGRASLGSAGVTLFTTTHNGTSIKTIRSAPDAEGDNNLGNLPTF
jgi:hypothetical protein